MISNKKLQELKAVKILNSLIVGDTFKVPTYFFELLG